MSDNYEHMIFRCPYCFSLGSDVYLNRDDSGHYCLRCSFTGGVADINLRYDEFTKKYHLVDKRISLEYQRKNI